MALQGETPEAVAYALFRNIAAIERKSVDGTASGEFATRQWILDTYAECLEAAKRNRTFKRD